MGRLQGKRAVVLGAPRPDTMGQVIARRFVGEGAKVVVAGRRSAPIPRVFAPGRCASIRNCGMNCAEDARVVLAQAG